MKRKIAIVAGGDSSEHDVSLRSAEGILSFMDKEKYDCYIVEIRTGGNWTVFTDRRSALSTAMTSRLTPLMANAITLTLPTSPFTAHLAKMVSCRVTSTL